MNKSHSILNLSAIDLSELKSTPFPYFGLNNSLDNSHFPDLLKDFPSLKKGGSFSVEDVEIKGSIRKLIDEIEGDAFRALMGKKFDLDLTGKPIITTLRGYSRQKDGQVHTDSKTKLITILIYLNDGWEHKTGRLRMLNSNQLEDYTEEFSSDIGQMIAFKVTENCWHGYHPYDGQRQSLQINYLAEERFTRQHQYRHKVSAFFKRLFK